MEENRPLVVVDNDYKYGVKHGYFPKSNLEGMFELMTIEEAREKGRFKSLPTEDDADYTGYYVYNPYADSYSLLTDPNVDNDFIITESVAYKEALIRLGAKEIEIEKFVGDTVFSKKKGNLEGSYGPVEGGMEGNSSKTIKDELTSKLTFSDPNNYASYAEAEKYIENHGLALDSNLTSWLMRLKERGELKGKETLSITYLKEINDVWNIVAKLDLKTFSMKFGIESEVAASRKYEVTVKVDFGL